MSTDPPLPKSSRSGPDPFHDLHPVLWNPLHPEAHPEARAETASLNGEIYSIRRNHGVKGYYKLHNPNDAINDDLPASEKTLLEYMINGRGYSIYSIGDLLNAPYPVDHEGSGNIMGDIAERIARRIAKYFLKHWSKRGWTGGIFDKRFDPSHRDDFIIASTSDYVLKIDHYPNLILLKRTGKGKFGYESIKELDGFFDYRYGGKQHILVLESKLEKINVNCDDLIDRLFMPLRELFPEARFHYLLFTDKNSVYVRNNFLRRRQIKQTPVKIHERLAREGIGSIFFTFNESREDFERMKDFLILQCRTVQNRSVTLRGRTVLSEKELLVFDGGETPRIKLLKDPATGHWKEVKLRHKRKG